VRRYVEEFAGGLDEFFIRISKRPGDERDIILFHRLRPGKDGGS
jgi:hypothetical protein